MKKLSKNSLSTFALGLACTILLFSCRKDVIELPLCIDSTENICEPFPESGSSEGYSIISEGKQFTSPCFNPNNSNEFIYIKEISPTETHLVKHNLLTNQEVTICESEIIISQPDWGNQGWIIFSKVGIRVMKVFEDGSGLEQITQFEASKPKFDINGNYFIIMNNTLGLTDGYRPILDLNGDLVDSVKYKFGEISTGYPYQSSSEKFNQSYQFYSDHSLPSGEKIGFGYQNGNSSFTELNNFTYKNQILGMAAKSDKVFYSEFYGSLYTIDINTKITTESIQGCPSRYFEEITISPNGDFLLVERVDLNVLNPYQIDKQQEIWKIDLTNFKETKVIGE